MNRPLRVARVVWAALAVPPWPAWQLATGDPRRGLHPQVLDALDADPLGGVELPRGGPGDARSPSRRAPGARPGDARRAPASRTRTTAQPVDRGRPGPAHGRPPPESPAARRRDGFPPGVPGRRQASAWPPFASGAPGTVAAGPPGAPAPARALPGDSTPAGSSVPPGTGAAHTFAAPATPRAPGPGAAPAAETLARILELVVGLRSAAVPAPPAVVAGPVGPRDHPIAASERGGARPPRLDQPRPPAAWLHALTAVQARPADTTAAGERNRTAPSDGALDGAVLADLVNTELADQARRHGVDVA